ncbi:hypothetical protein [Brevibacillus porteri]|uniref:hypothetical protein n=1 Tax=Brevibacillus porteri TaxID=2126350 RepID=UPI003D22BBD8
MAILESLGTWSQNTSKVLDQNNYIYLLSHASTSELASSISFSPGGSVAVAGYDTTTYTMIPTSANGTVTLGSLPNITSINLFRVRKRSALESLGTWTKSTSKVMDQANYLYLFTHLSTGELVSGITLTPGGSVAVAGYDTTTYTMIPTSANGTVTLGSLPNITSINLFRLSLNAPPTVSLSSPSNDQVLTEGATYTIAGTASDPDSGNAVTIRYAINGGTARNITSAISDGVSPIPFSKVLTFQNGRLYDGATDVSGPLAENTTYTVNVYAVDDQGGTSTSYTRSFKVILNRPPVITLNAYNANRTGLSELETLVFTGTVTDPENDNVNLTVAFNGGESIPLKAGVPSGTTFEYVIPVSALANGTNTAVFTATDTKGAAKTKTLTFAKSGTQTPVKTAVVRYAITPPLGTTAEIVAWINREAGDLTVVAAHSIVASGVNESYTNMTKNASVPIGDGTVYEDEFVGTAAQAGARVTLRLTLNRTDVNATKAVKKIMGGIG